MQRAVVALLLAAAATIPTGSPLSAADTGEAILVLDVVAVSVPGRVWSAAPPRFALFEDGQVYVGGTSQLAAGHLEKSETKAIDDQLALVRKLPGLGSSMTFAEGGPRYRLQVRKGKPLDLVVTGDPAAAPPAMKPLAALLTTLAAFEHASLRPYEPANYALAAREAAMPGGCRAWAFPVPLNEVVSGPHGVPPSEAVEWPTGATPAAVCEGGKTYQVTLRPLLPGERP
jgi:hypothetical protein